MGKRKSSTSSSDLDSDEDKPEQKKSKMRKQIKALSQAANLNPSNLLLKKGLMNSEIQNILRKKLTSIATKVQKSKKKTVSSSDSHSPSEDETKTVVKSVHGKKQDISKSEGSSGKETFRKQESSEDSESDSSDTSYIKKRDECIQNESTSESELESYKQIPIIPSSLKTDADISSKNYLIKKMDTKSHKSSSQSENSDKDEKMMKKIERNIPKKGKVHILQDIRLSPVKAETPKDQLKILYPHLKHIKTKVELKFSHCVVHLFRIPNSVDPYLLINREINLEENCKIKLDEKYIIEATTKFSDPTLIVSDHSKILNLRKNLVMTRNVKAKKQRDISVSEKSNVKLPENIKDRDPLYGPSFEDKIHLSEEVENKIDEAIANVMKRIKKKKVKKIKQEPEDNHKNEVIYDLLNVPSISAAKIKTEISDDSAFSSCSSLKKSKKKHKDYKNVLENIKQELDTSYETVAVKKMHKKRKKKNKEKDAEQASFLETIKQNMDSHTPKKKKNKLVNSTLMSDASTIPSLSPNLSSITSVAHDTVKKGKKSKRKHTTPTEETIEHSISANILDDINTDLSLPKKVKKKKMHRSLD